MKAMKPKETWSKYRLVLPWKMSEQECLLAVSELHQALQEPSGLDLRDQVAMENLYEHLLEWTGTGHEMLVVHHGEGPHPAGHVWMWERDIRTALATPLVKVVLPAHGLHKLADGDDGGLAQTAQELCPQEAYRLCPEWAGAWVVTDGVATAVSPKEALATAMTFQGGEDSPWPHMPWDQGLILKARLRRIRRERV